MSHPKTCISSRLREVEQSAFFPLLLFFEPQPFRCLDLRDCDLTRCLSLWLKPPRAAVNPFLALFTVLLSVKFFGPLRIKTWTGVLTQQSVRVWSSVSQKRRLRFLLPLFSNMHRLQRFPAPNSCKSTLNCFQLALDLKGEEVLSCDGDRKYANGGCGPVEALMRKGLSEWDNFSSLEAQLSPSWCVFHIPDKTETFPDTFSPSHTLAVFTLQKV